MSMMSWRENNAAYRVVMRWSPRHRRHYPAGRSFKSRVATFDEVRTNGSLLVFHAMEARPKMLALFEGERNDSDQATQHRP